MQRRYPSNPDESERDDTVVRPGLRRIQPAIEHLEQASRLGPLQSPAGAIARRAAREHPGRRRSVRYRTDSHPPVCIEPHHAAKKHVGVRSRRFVLVQPDAVAIVGRGIVCARASVHQAQPVRRRPAAAACRLLSSGNARQLQAKDGRSRPGRRQCCSRSGPGALWRCQRRTRRPGATARWSGCRPIGRGSPCKPRAPPTGRETQAVKRRRSGTSLS